MSEGNYQFLTAEEFAHVIASAPINTVFNFTLDQSTDEFVYGQPEGWYGAKITRIFDEREGLFAIGAYGGGETIVRDILGDWAGENIDHCIEEELENYAITSIGFSQLFCVEVEKCNQKYIERIISND